MSFAPLPRRKADERPALSGARAANAGLLYNKFVDRWERKDDTLTLGENKARWVSEFARTVGRQADISRAAGRMRRLAEARGGRSWEMTTTSPFVTGMGISHPIENGFLWHHTLGTPHLPGSSIKGLARHWVEHWAIPDGSNHPTEEEEIWRLFGPPPGSANMMGALIVFDALPLEPVKLMAEVMTPHDDGWRLDTSGTHQPADWVSPNPIPFLAVAPGNRFLFSVAPARGGTTDDVDAAFEWIAEALDWLGAGAKTSSGFGRFEDPQRKADEITKIEAIRPAQTGDRVIIKENHPDPKWRGLTGELIPSAVAGR